MKGRGREDSPRKKHGKVQKQNSLILTTLLFVTVQPAQAQNYTLTQDGKTFTNDSTRETINEDAINIPTNVNNATVINNSTITTTGTGDGINSKGDNATITNADNATIETANAEGIRSDGAYAAITNDGTIETNGDGEKHGIHSKGDNTTATNNGTITVNGSAIGMVATSTDINTLLNNGLIETADTGMMINSGDEVGNDTLCGTITNNGTITVASDPSLFYNAGIWNAMSNSTVTNNGTISATGLEEPTGIYVGGSAYDDNFIGIDTSIPCGLIINELLSNSLKHAFPEKRKGEIEIKIYKTDDDEIEMLFRDNGIGLPEKYDFRNSPGFGFRMIIDLVEYKLMGRINLIRGESFPSALAEASTVPAYRQAGGGEGTQFQILFKEIKYKKRI